MAAEVQTNPVQESKHNDKELNFRALEAKYQRELQQERSARLEAEKVAQEVISKKQHDNDEEDSEPYVDHRKLEKKLSSFEKKLEDKIDKKAEEKARSFVEAERKNTWMDANPDFYEVLQYAEKLAQKNPELADSILKMPDSFERQKLVYSNIKALGLNKPEIKQSSTQEKIDANRKSPYYQPSGVAPAPYASASDFSAAGQKNAYDKMQELKNRLRL